MIQTAAGVLSLRQGHCLSVMRRSGERTFTGSSLARLLNLDGPCDWCPVLPPAAGRCFARFPRTSVARARRVLLALRAKGILADRHPFLRRGFYLRSGSTQK